MSTRIPLAATLAALLGLTSFAQAASLTYRGYLEDGGAPAEGRYDIRLTAYADAQSMLPVALPVELEGVALNAGQFAAALPEGLLPAHLDQAWLAVEVRAEGEGTWWALPGRQAVAPKGALCPPAWELTGNPGTNPASNFLGTADNQPLNFRVNNLRVQRFEHGSVSPRIIGGHSTNAVLGDTVSGAFIGGGGLQSQANVVSNSYSSVLGGRLNTTSGENAAVLGGFNNTASGNGSVVAGGWTNTASGLRSMVPGGFSNCAGGNQSWAGGQRAKIRPGTLSGDAGAACQGIDISGTDGDRNTFAWADSQNADFISTGSNQFLVRALGGIYLGTNSTVSLPAGRFINTSTGAHLTTGGVWTNASSRARKTDFAPVNAQDILARLLELEISTWSYREGAEARHIGPVAEDFHALFGLGTDNASIGTVDASGVALVAIQALAAREDDSRQALVQVERDNRAMREEIDALRTELALLRELVAPAVAGGGR